MALPLPNLDDRRWLELVDEARTLIPVYAPGWTDHNLHDPGITFLEMLAWIAEMGIYQANRIPDRHRFAFLALAGIDPRRPRGASTVTGFELAAGAPPTPLPAGIEMAPLPGAPAELVRFRTEESLVVVPGRLVAIQSGPPDDLVDLSASVRRGEWLAAFDDDPQPGAALYLGLSEPLPVNTSSRLQLVVEGGDAEERSRILQQLEAERAACERPGSGIECDCAGATRCDGEDLEPGAGDESAAVSVPLEHHSVRLIWEQWVAPGVWRPLDAAAGEVEDDTRALTLDGAVVVRLPEATTPIALGNVPGPLHYLRARLLGGSYDAPPRLRLVQLNGVPARQASAVATTWRLGKGATISGPAPASGDRTGLRFTVDPRGAIDTLEFTADQPRFLVLGYQPPSAMTDGWLELEAALLGVGSGGPHQFFSLPQAPVAGSSLQVFSQEGGSWRTWTERPSWRRSGRRDPHYLLDADRGQLTLGDGERGRVLPRAAFLVAVHEATEGAGGNLRAGSIAALARTAHNRALVAGFDAVVAHVQRVLQPLGAEGGVYGEVLAASAARALEDLKRPQRAVTLEDIEALAFETPGSRIARAKAKAAVHPAFPCIEAAGMVPVVAVPFPPAVRPSPSAELRRLVAAYLAPRRVLGTRIEVAAPEYVKITVRARVRACEMVQPGALVTRLRARLDAFFHPLSGGPDGGGWPFGRDVYRSEVLQVLDETEGADHVLSLALVDAEGTAVCGNLCLPPCGLVDSGEHEIEAVP
jgi:predicted phage baseplate assembly protein